MATKLDRAEALLAELRAMFEAYWATEPLQPFEASGTVTHTTNVGYQLVTGPPDDFPLVVGDVIQNLRAALDHEVYVQTVGFSGADSPYLENSEFPIFASQPKYEDGGRASRIAGCSDRVRAVIDGMQPFAGGELPSRLALLHELARYDRHRFLAVTPVALHGAQVTLKPAAEGDLTTRPGGKGHISGRIGDPDATPTSHFDVRLTFTIQFASGPANGRRVISTLGELAEAVTTAVNMIREAGDSSAS